MSGPNEYYDWLPEARQIAAQCWCDDETKHLVMEPALAEAVARRVAAWMQTGAQHARNEEYWRDRALKAEAAPIVPQGWKLVPVEPTPEMVRAADDELMTPLSGMSRGSGPVRVYRAMLAASPAPDADGVETNDGGRDA